ncbi:MAG: OmpA family protein, partial [Alphaproteobacteria bacterium]
AVPMASPFAWRIEKGADGNAVITGHHPSADAESALAALARPAARGSVTDASRIAHGAPPGDWLGAARLAIEAVAELESGAAVLSDTELLVRGVAKDDAASRAVQSRVAERTPAGFRSKFELTTVLDEELKGPAIVAAERCQGLLESVSGTETVEFVFDGPALHARQRRFFERVAAALARCPGFAVEIGAHTSGSGDPDAARALSDRWAQAAAEALVRAGVGRGRLRAVGHGNTRPVADGATEAGRQRNRRIVFRIVT